MITTKGKSKKYFFTPSINILRDEEAHLHYIPTSNSISVYNQIQTNYKIGIRSFNIVGAYGTGKSAFLLAFLKNVGLKETYFSKSKFDSELNGFSFLNIVGEYSSLIDYFAEKFNLANRKTLRVSDIIAKLKDHQLKLSKEKKGFVILIDEFGKFLEFAAKNNPDKELYFIQQLSELINDTSNNTLFITTLHQDFNGYARDLTKTQQNEWDKIKGRIKEITFNEPVEQLLFLASERLGELTTITTKPKHFTSLFKSIESSKAFPLKDYFNVEVAAKLQPFDILSAAILTLSLQKYGQNERSLFSFIESNDPLGINDVSDKSAPYYNIGKVYDYLIHNYYSYLSTRYNSHYSQWAAIRTAIERAEGLIEHRITDAIKLLKVIGLLNIFSSKAIGLTAEFLDSYSRYSLGINNIDEVLKALEGLKIIRFVKHLNKYILFEGTDVDIELAIDNAGNLIERVTDVVHHLNNHFEFPFLSAKAAHYNTGTPRIFAFTLTDSPVIKEAVGEIDGYINLVFSDKINGQQVADISAVSEEAILYGFFTNTIEIKNLIFEIEKIKKAKETYFEDKIAVRELNKILDYQIRLLNHFVLGSLYNPSIVEWFFQGQRVNLTNPRVFNRFLSDICDLVYNFTPVYKNEMVNKTKLSGAIVVAKKNLISALISNWHRKDLNFDDNKFPPEKTIYLSLLKATGLHRLVNGGYILDAPTNENLQFEGLWQHSNAFLISTQNGKRSIQELVDSLLSKPFKLKRGFIEFWLPIFLFAKRDDFALFHDEIYIPFLSQDNLELIWKNPKEYEVKAFDIAGVKLNIFNSYRKFLNQSEKDRPTAPNFIETIRPFLTFYKQLPNYAKNTTRLNKKTTNLRQAIAQAKDPEDTFFEQFPKALGFTINEIQSDSAKLVLFADALQDSIKEIRTSFDRLINRIENFIFKEIIGEKLPFKEYKAALQNRFIDLKEHLLLPHQLPFIQRLGSQTTDNTAWLSSVSFACIGKALEDFSDRDEVIFYERLKNLIHELDNLCEISKSGIDLEKEIAFKLEVTSFVEGLKKNFVRLPKSKNKELIVLRGSLTAMLSNDKQLNIATLAKLLEELLENEEG